MASVKPELYLYNLTLNRAFASTNSVIGNFTFVSKSSKTKRSQELIIASSSVLTLYRFNSSTGKLSKIFDHDTFSAIRCISTFKVSGSTTDSVVVTSDSGNLSVLGVNSKNTAFEAVYNEPYSKTGMTRLIPGEYISVDSKSRALMISAVEKNKLVYVLNRDVELNKITVSSPLEANKSRTLTFFTCGLDVGYENPIFASIECDYGEHQQKSITTDKGDLSYTKILNYYELDLGLNHVVRRFSEKIDQSSNFMLAIPGGLDGPSGLLLCSKNLVQYKFLDEKTHSVPIPRRSSNKDAESYIINGVVHKMKGSFFILLQNNFGDLFKVNVNHDSDTIENPGEINSIEIKYFDTLPITRSLLIFKSGFLFADSEHGDKYIYQFEKTGDEDDDKVWRSTNYPEPVDAIIEEDVYFDIKNLDNLGLVEILDSLNPLMDSKLLRTRGDESGGGMPTILTACGTGARSALKILSRGVPISELVSSELPADAQAVFTTKVFEGDQFDRYLVLSFLDGTLVLSIGESVEEVTTSGLSTNGPTILVQQMGKRSITQVQSDSVRSLAYDPEAPDAEPLAQQWLPPAGIKILRATATESQLAIGLSNRELVYFEFVDEKLVEFEERPEILGAISSLSLQKVEEGRLRSNYLAVGTSESTIHIFSVDPSARLEELSVQALSSVPTDLAIMSMLDNSAASEDQRTSTLYLHIGMQDGIYARIRLDDKTGAFGDVRSAVIGHRPVKLSVLKLFDQNMIMCFSSRTYLGFSSESDFSLITITDKVLTHGSSFVSEDCPENGIVGVQSDVLTIFTADEVSSSFNFEIVNLRYTPKRMLAHKGLVYVIESDYNTKSAYIKDEDAGRDEQIETEENEEQQVFQQFGYPQHKNQWGSCIQRISITEKQVLETIELTKQNESFVSLTVVTFKEVDHLVVGVASGQTFLPNGAKGYSLRVYEITKNGLKFKHSTKIEGLPLSIVPFRERLLVGVENSLLTYDLGLKQLLRKSYCKLQCKQIVKIDTFGNRVAVADSRQSITFIVFKPLENKFIPFATDTIPRSVSTFNFVDYDTVIGSDRFGEIFVLRCTEEVSKLSDEDDHGTYLSTKESNLNDCPYRLDNLANYFTSDVITSFSKGRLSVNEGGPDAVIYTGLQGTVGILLPILHKSEIDFFVKLQKLIREENTSVTERDHLKYRSYYLPVKSVIDGDLIESYINLDATRKLKISGKLDNTVRNVEKRIADIRSRIYF